MERMLDVRNLKVSFRTNNGIVRAVRNISFTLNKGETLAIVGESGSGKSVTARSVMGILEGNSITESGEIFFDGQDLTKISEEYFHKIRGSKISMIFQDPFSSLNPIVRIGTQLTEAMFLNSRINRREAGREFNERLKLLAPFLGNIKGVRSVFRRYGEMEKSYGYACENISMRITAMDGVLIDMVRGEPKANIRRINGIIDDMKPCYHEDLVRPGALDAQIKVLKDACQKYAATGAADDVKISVGKIRNMLAAALQKNTGSDYFADCYSAFMKDDYSGVFLDGIARAVRESYGNSAKLKGTVIDAIDRTLPLFDNDNTGSRECRNAVNDLKKTVAASIDRLAITKDNLAHSFGFGCDCALNAYLKLRRGGETDTARLCDCRNNIRSILVRLRDSYREETGRAADMDFADIAKRTVEHLKKDSVKMLQQVSKSLAKMRAIRLMEEVGIPEAGARYLQYPFQFSGGMRQRIVIAIALAANPDLLICDEPTTALDVTIQAQILDLINSLKENRGLSVIFITHDLGVVANVADHIAVMYAGKIVEYGTVNEVFFEPAHPYTWALLASMPDLETTEKLDAIGGTPPNMIHPPAGDAFAARNKYAMEIDFLEEPPFFDVSPTHKAATWLLHPDAPEALPPKIVTERIRRMTEGLNG